MSGKVLSFVTYLCPVGVVARGVANFRCFRTPRPSTANKMETTINFTNFKMLTGYFVRKMHKKGFQKKKTNLNL